MAAPDVDVQEGLARAARGEPVPEAHSPAQGAPEAEPVEATVADLSPYAVALWAIFALLLLFALYFARSVALPVALASLASLVFGPVVRGLRRFRIPPPISAAVLLLGLLAALLYGVYALSGPAAGWMAARARQRARGRAEAPLPAPAGRGRERGHGAGRARHAARAHRPTRAPWSCSRTACRTSCSTRPRDS